MKIKKLWRVVFYFELPNGKKSGMTIHNRKSRAIRMYKRAYELTKFSIELYDSNDNKVSSSFITGSPIVQNKIHFPAI